MAVALQVAAAPVHVVFPIKVSTKSISASRFGTSLTPTRRSKSVVSDWVFPRRCRICASRPAAMFVPDLVDDTYRTIGWGLIEVLLLRVSQDAIVLVLLSCCSRCCSSCSSTRSADSDRASWVLPAPAVPASSCNPGGSRSQSFLDGAAAEEDEEEEAWLESAGGGGTPKRNGYV